MNTLTIPGLPASVKNKILSRSGSPAGTIEQQLVPSWGPQDDPENPSVTEDTPERDITGNAETRHHWKAPPEETLRAKSMETLTAESIRVKHSDPMLGELAERLAGIGQLDSRDVDDVAAYVKTHLMALLSVMDHFLDGDRNNPAEEMMDGITSAFHRKASRYRSMFHRANADLADLERAWVGDEIQHARRQELEEKRDAASEISARFDLLSMVSMQVYEVVSGSEWVPPNEKRNNPVFATAGAAAAMYVTSSVAGPDAAATRRVIIMGDNESNDVDSIVKVIDAIVAKHGKEITIYTGNSKTGIEAGVRGICASRKIPHKIYAPDFKTFGKRAAFERNRTMFTEAKPHGVVIIGGSGVQADVKQIAIKLNIPVKTIQEPAARKAS